MPFREGRTIVGWGVVRLDPWEFDRVYERREEAEAEAAKLGPGYQVLWGEHDEGTDNFIFAGSTNDDDEENDRRVTEDGDHRVTEDGHRRVTEDGDYLVTEDGDPIVTEDGSRIRLETPPETIGVTDAVEAEIVRSERWTGVESRAQRLVQLQGQLSVAHASIGYLINELADTEGNGGPLLDEHAEALEALRSLHRTLGDLLDAVDRGTFNDELGEGLIAEIARYAHLATDALRNDPARFVLSATIFAVLSACGLSEAGGFIASAAVSIKKAPATRAPK